MTFGTLLVKLDTSPVHVVGIIPVFVRYCNQSGDGTALPMQLNCCAADGQTRLVHGRGDER